jgi:hypothetical protein
MNTALALGVVELNAQREIDLLLRPLAYPVPPGAPAEQLLPHPRALGCVPHPRRTCMLISPLTHRAQAQTSHQVPAPPPSGLWCCTCDKCDKCDGEGGRCGAAACWEELRNLELMWWCKSKRSRGWCGCLAECCVASAALAWQEQCEAGCSAANERGDQLLQQLLQSVLHIWLNQARVMEARHDRCVPLSMQRRRWSWDQYLHAAPRSQCYISGSLRPGGCDSS